MITTEALTMRETLKMPAHYAALNQAECIQVEGGASRVVSSVLYGIARILDGVDYTRSDYYNTDTKDATGAVVQQGGNVYTASHSEEVDSGKSNMWSFRFGTIVRGVADVLYAFGL
jgi:hypothetical protein